MNSPKVTKLHTLTGHNDCIYVLEKGDSPSTFFSAAGDGMVAYWDLNAPGNGKLVAKVQNSVYALHFDATTNNLYVGHNQEGIHKIDLTTLHESASAKITQSAIFDIQQQGNLLFAGTQDGHLIVLDASDLSVYRKLKLADKSLRTIAINAQNGHLAAGFSDHSLRILDLKNLSTLHEIPAHTNSIFAVRYSPCGRYLLSGGRDAQLNSWEVANDYVNHQKIVAHMYAINDIHYRPDGKLFATCSMDKSVKIWDAENFQLLKVIDKARHAGHGTSVNKLFWSNYEGQLISCSDDRTISVWGIEENK
jgi:WD repeat-containing protein 61